VKIELLLIARIGFEGGRGSGQFHKNQFLKEDYTWRDVRFL
jgi:hypothetical protein